MTGDQLNFKMATKRDEARTDQVFARASTSGLGRQDEASAAADKDLGEPANKQWKKSAQTFSKSGLV